MADAAPARRRRPDRPPRPAARPDEHPLHRGAVASGRPRRRTPRRTRPPSGLIGSLASQLDLKAIDLDDALTVYENTNWIPVRAQLSSGAAAASAEAGFDVLVRADLTGSTAVLDQPEGAVGAAWPGRSAGTVFVGEGASLGLAAHGGRQDGHAQPGLRLGQRLRGAGCGARPRCATTRRRSGGSPSWSRPCAGSSCCGWRCGSAIAASRRRGGRRRHGRAHRPRRRAAAGRRGRDARGPRSAGSTPAIGVAASRPGPLRPAPGAPAPTPARSRAARPPTACPRPTMTPCGGGTEAADPCRRRALARARRAARLVHAVSVPRAAWRAWPRPCRFVPWPSSPRCWWSV